jgi:DNA gyrase/topoisomerase IV subunit B
MAKLPSLRGKDHDPTGPKAQPFKEAVRQKPGMYFGGVGPNILPGIVVEIFQRFLSEDPQYRGKIDVECSIRAGQQRICVTFHDFDSGDFAAPEINTWKKTLNARHHVSMLYVVVAAASYFRLESSNGRELGSLTVTDKASRAHTSTRSAGKYVRITIEPLHRLFGLLGHNAYYQLSGTLRDFALLRKGLQICLINRDPPSTIQYHYERGLESSLLEEDYCRWELHPDVLRFSKHKGPMRVEGCLRFVHAGIPRVRTYVNFRPTQGGTDLEGLGDVLQKIFPDSKLGCRELTFVTNPDTGASICVPRAFIGAMHLQYLNVRYAGPTRDVIMSPEVRAFVEEAASGLKAQWDKLDAQRVAAEKLERLV